MQPERILYLSPDCTVSLATLFPVCAAREIGDKINLFSLHTWCSLCCHHKLLNRTFLHCVSILFSLHLFTSDFLKAPGFPWRQRKLGRWILKDSCSCGYSTFWQEKWMKKDNSTWVHLYLSRSDVSRSQKSAEGLFNNHSSKLCHIMHVIIFHPTVFAFYQRWQLMMTEMHNKISGCSLKMLLHVFHLLRLVCGGKKITH